MARDGLKIFDCDLHVCEPIDLWQRYIDPRFKDQALRGAPTIGAFSNMELVVEGLSTDIEQFNDVAMRAAERHGRMAMYEDYEARGWDAKVQLEAMDHEGIDMAVLFPSRGLGANGKHYDDEALGNAIVRAYNDWLGEFCETDKQRLYGAAMVLPQNVPDTIAEIRRTVLDYGFRGIYIRPNPVCQRNWHDRIYDPLWETCEELQLLVGFHEGAPCTLPYAAAERFRGGNEDLWLTDHVIRHPVEMMYAAVCMIMGGVLERFPRLKVAFLEANCSWVPYWLWRMEEHFEMRETQTRFSRTPTQYFRDQCFVSVEADEHTAGDAIATLGDNIAFSTDFPHPDSAFPNGVDTFLQQSFSRQSKQKILWDNPRRMYGFDEPGNHRFA